MAIDPGTTESAYVTFNTHSLGVLECGKIPNEDMITKIAVNRPLKLLIEMIKSYGMPMGDTTIKTCVWIGRFIQEHGGQVELIPRKTIVSELCKRVTAGDRNLRQALIDYFTEHRGNELGGGATPVVGTKKAPGPLYGVKKDIWSALALAVIWTERLKYSDMNVKSMMR